MVPLFERFRKRVEPHLGADEQPVAAARGYQARSRAVDFISRWFTLPLLMRYVLVFTNRRLFAFPTGGDFLFGGATSIAWYGDIESAKLGGAFGRRLQLAYRDGSKDTFILTDRGERSAVAGIEPLFSSAGERGDGGRSFLCPRCGRSIPRGAFVCPGCGLEFKSPAEAKRRALLIPGGGYFYFREWFRGTLAALGEVLILWWMFAVIVEGLSQGFTIVSYQALLYCAILLAIEKAFTTRHVLVLASAYVPDE